MRNLKKLFAVILTVAMLASMMIPALAANTYEAEALQLQAINVFAGGPEDLKLDESVTRIQGLAFAIRAAGKDAEALAMEEAEVDAILADWTDADSIPAWGRGYAAYAIKNKITVGLSATENIFGAMQIISGRSLLVFIMKSGMGYADVTTANVIEASVTAGILTAGQAATFGAKEALIRDDAAGILFGAFSTGVNADGSKLIDAYIASGATTLADAAAAGFVTANTMSVEAAKVDTLEVTFAYAVDTADINLAVTKGGNKVDAAAPVWSDGNTVATIKTTAKMTNGTYTVTATSASDEDFELTGTVEITSQYVAEIVILNDVALTGSSDPDNEPNKGDEAYVYYDVLDQYGESLRTSTSILWSFSTTGTDNRSSGKITLSRSDGNAFTYGEKIYITGVYAKTGLSVTKELTVGMKQALDSIEVAGFVKKGTSTILEALPSGFKADTYYMVYTLKDQNGNSYTVTNPIAANEVTFVSDNVLLIKELTKGETTLTIAGDEYNAVFVSPGMSVDKGGEANITAIANKTGNKTVINVVVGEDQILTSFTMSSPSGVLADGEKIEIPFVALDQNGNEIKNFVTIAKQADFNKLSFTTSVGTLTLSEKADGTAKLEYDDIDLGWADSQTTDGIDRIVSLTSVVVGGDTSNLTLNVTDKARPDAIKSVDMDNVLVEKGSDTIYLNGSDDDDYGSSFVFLDQYGREMDEEDSGAFFAATGLKGAEFEGYNFVVRATFKGDTGETGFWTINDTAMTADPDVSKEFEIDFDGTFDKDADTPDYGGVLTIGATGDVVSAKSGFTLKFDIVKYKPTGTGDYVGFENAQAVSSAKNEELTIIDITAVRSFSIDDVNKFYVETAGTAFDTGKLALASDGSDGIDDITDPIGSDLPIGGTEADPDYQHEVKVKGTYNGQSVSIPGDYLSFSSGKLNFDGANAISIKGAELKYSDLYDVKTAQYLRKDATDTVKAVVSYEATSGDAIVVKTLDTISKSIAIADAAPEVTTIEGNDTWTVAPTQTAIGNLADIDGDDKYEVKYKDQYGVEIAVTPTYRITSIVPNAAGYADNNFKVSGNDSSAVNINGAERGDTFVWIIKAGDVTKEVKVTVVADTDANITGNVNNYLDVLVLDKPIPEGDEYGPDGLEAQRINGLE